MNFIIEAVLLSVAITPLYILIAVLPGTDETATMAPVFLMLALLGVDPRALFAAFIACCTTMQMAHTIPTAMTGIPGSVMAAPMVSYSMGLKAMGVPHVSMRKMAAGSFIGTIISIPIAFGVAIALAPLGDIIKQYAGLLFTIGAILLALMSKNKLINLIAIFPLATLLYGVTVMSTDVLKVGSPFISIFMGITIGPLIVDELSLLVPDLKKRQAVSGPRKIALGPEVRWGGFFQNPFKILTREQKFWVLLASAISSITFTFSPVGMTILLGELVSKKFKEAYQRATTTVAVMDSITNATYIAETIIPLLAFGLPLSPMALGPAQPLFNAPPRFWVDLKTGTHYNLHDILQPLDYLWLGYLGAIIALIITYPLTVNYARKMTILTFKYVPHEVLLSFFTALILGLGLYSNGIAGALIALLIAIVGGTLNKFFGVNYGVQFMSYYASTWLVTNLVRIF